MSLSPQDLLRPAERMVTAALTARCAHDPDLWLYTRDWICEPLPGVDPVRSRMRLLLAVVQRCCLISLEVARSSTGPVLDAQRQITPEALAAARRFLGDCASTLPDSDPAHVGLMLWACSLQLDLDQERQAQLLVDVAGPEIPADHVRALTFSGVDLAHAATVTAAAQLGLDSAEYLKRMGLRSFA
jgi:hypothetical protein